ncbi:MAG: hypothetical protein GTO16_13400 [Candidatus Aminicenantes bacterium]|nr:hypothetical protein [Candidatus Aminicenantes bacterium]
MKKFYLVFLTVLLSLTFTSFSSAQDQEEGMIRAVAITPGIGFEFFSRTITWDDDQYTSKLKSSFFTFNTEFEFRKGFFLNAVLGYAIPGSSYKGLTFRELPISVELNVGSIKGYLLGAEVKKSFIYAKDLEIDLLGQLFYYMGSKKEWEVPDLAVEGTVEGDPSWIRASIGPVFTYTGFDAFHLYLYLNFNKLWGKFKMVQTIDVLEGSENQKISGVSSFGASLGSIFNLTDAFGIKTEASFIPHGDSVDLGFTVRAIYSF